ncbi:hypothetical protein [uncultured Clostridium sp.]|uniref:hypothetical protein n=1 Tax=uncultured Clostridium sp. TaxID=59620 RepID=UPI0025876C2C|nr:hypothetical protein [uncultured Clostridium sp.]
MELKKLTERIYYTESDSKSDRPVLGYILGDKCSVMIDAGNSENHVKDYNYALEKNGFKRPKYSNPIGKKEIINFLGKFIH